MKRRAIFQTIFLLLAARLIVAQEPSAAAKCEVRGRIPTREETLIVTRTYEPVVLEESERAVEVVVPRDHEVLFNSFVDGLRADPSVGVRQRAPGVQADLSIRGSSSQQTLVLIDGLRVNDAQSGHHNLDLPLPFHSLERIEVLHGSGSTMYGSDAVGGTVNFITAPSSSTEVVLGAREGTSAEIRSMEPLRTANQTSQSR